MRTSQKMLFLPLERQCCDGYRADKIDGERIHFQTLKSVRGKDESGGDGR